MANRITIIHRAQCAHLAALFALGTLPLAGATAGALIDEHGHLGFTNWRSACNAAGFSFQSVVTFSIELLPSAIAGLFAGGAVLLGLGFASRRRRGHLELCLAAHAGCVFSMPIGLSLCAGVLPLPAMLIADAFLTFAAAWLAFLAIRSDAYSHRRNPVMDRIPPC